MAEAQLCGLRDEITCSVCLDTLTDPVSLHCGHSFCLKCLTDYWDQSQVSSCPQCREAFTTRPALHINTVLNEVIKKLKKAGLISRPLSFQNYAGPGAVECDFCTEKKFRALKSCLTCMASFCQTHLQPHYEVAAWKDHKLVDPDRNLKEKLCGKHHKSLEIFCKTDETYICMMCVVTGHKNHEMVELETEREQKQKQLGATLSDIKRRLEEREKTLKETRRAMNEMKISVEKEVQEHEKSFTNLIHCIKQTCSKVTERIREQEKRETEKAEGVIERLEKQIEELRRREAELKELSETKDHLHFLQTFSSHSVLNDDGDSLSFTVAADFSSEDLRNELYSLKKSLEKISQWDFMTRTPSGHAAPVFALQTPEPRSREEFLQYSCPLTLDIKMAHRCLFLSEENKQVTRHWKMNTYPNRSQRFDCWEQVLCSEALNGNRFYWEVEWTGKSMAIGVASEGLSRKGPGRECGLGYNDKSWSLYRSDSQYFVCHNNKETLIRAPHNPRIGVCLDWPAGSLSFYSVSPTMTLLHRFNTSFTEPLYPGFWVYLNSSVTICQLRPCDK
ncbi:TRI16 protein, partial [Polypterus senegalus]|nr:tripartite motif-containing protein 16-like [Polypterus senegalus]MBN3294199.1 TRI16 protein [Polypterus senegalus]